MGKLIDGDKLISTLVWGHYEIGKQLQTVQKAINDMRGEDAVPVRHGKWIKGFEDEDGQFVRCSECRMVFYAGKGRDGNYCPNCGARMDADD